MSTSMRIYSVVGKLCSKEDIFFSSNKRSWGDNPGLLQQFRGTTEDLVTSCASDLPFIGFYQCLFGCSQTHAAPDITPAFHVGGRKKEKRATEKGKYCVICSFLDIFFLLCFFFLGYRFYLLMYFWLCWVFIAGWAFPSSYGEQQLLSGCSAHTSLCSGFFCCRAQAVGHMDFSSCSSWASEHRFSSCGTQA